jgi:prophage maintenance system killer protein
LPGLSYLDRHDIESIVHTLAANLFSNYDDPLPPFQLFGGLREGGALLESALALPRQPYYRRLHDKAGALLRSLIKNHPLVDGNKRIGL